LQNSRNRFSECGDDELRLLAQRLAITVIDEDRAATGGVRAINVAPAIANEEAVLQIDIVLRRGAEQHPWLRFPAIAGIVVAFTGVIANFDRIERRNGGPQFFVHRFDHFANLGTAPDIRLIADDNQEKAGRFQFRASLSDAGIKFELLDVRRRKGKTIADHGPVENAVAIEKDGAPFYFVLSHFVCAVLSAG